MTTPETEEVFTLADGISEVIAELVDAKRVFTSNEDIMLRAVKTYPELVNRSPEGKQQLLKEGINKTAIPSQEENLSGDYRLPDAYILPVTGYAMKLLKKKKYLSSWDTEAMRKATPGLAGGGRAGKLAKSSGVMYVKANEINAPELLKLAGVQRVNVMSSPSGEGILNKTNRLMQKGLDVKTMPRVEATAVMLPVQENAALRRAKTHEKHVKSALAKRAKAK